MFITELLHEIMKSAVYGFRLATNPAVIEYRTVRVPLRETPQLQRIRKQVYRGVYEAEEIHTLSKLLRPEDVVLEIGAGAGIVSAFIAKRLATPRQITAYEANPALLASIKAVATANGIEVRVMNAAVGAVSGHADFFFDERFTSSSLIDRKTNAKPSRVEIVALSKLMVELKPSVIVIDAEGAEKDILDFDFPAHVRLIAGEIHPHIIGDAAVSRIYRRLLEQGFSIRIDHGQGRAFAFERPESLESHTASAA